MAMQRFSINTHPIYDALAEQVRIAEQAVAAHKQATQAAESQGEMQLQLAKCKLDAATKTLKGLRAVMTSLQACCCDEPAFG